MSASVRARAGGLRYMGGSRMVESNYADGSQWAAWQGSSGAVSTDWDQAGRRTRGVVRAGSAGAVFFEEQIGYDGNDRVTSLVWPHGRAGADAEAQTFAYDQLGRLLTFRQGLWDGAAVTGTPTAFHDWNLDEVGNWREHKQSESETFWTPEVDPVNAYSKWDASFDRDGDGVEEALALVREHDATRGFLFRKEEEGGTHTRYVHDALGRLVEVQRETDGSPETVVRYGYDTAGRLSWREEAGGDGRTWLVHDGGSTVLEIADESTGRRELWVNVWAGSTLVRAQDENGKVLYLHQDRLGSIVVATRSESGSPVMDGGAAYDPYGRKVSLPDWSPGELAVPYGYAGARLEPLAAADIDRDGDGIAEEQRGLYLMGARWYDPQTGRFIEQDPIGEDGGLNLYAYTGSSPISWTDPTGLRPKSRVPGVGSGPTGRGYQVKVDGRNTTDSLTGNQVYTLAYARDGGGDTTNTGDEANEPPADAASQKDAGEAKPQDQADAKEGATSDNLPEDDLPQETQNPSPDPGSNPPQSGGEKPEQGSESTGGVSSNAPST
ncbi:MAG TPA: hypothetical protein ENK10_01805, partial [Acidobacteria bacterium]|nr:hypothetical protein [Acidobacteriota bacterium]